jgi:hypothetical protein
VSEHSEALAREIILAVGGDLKRVKETAAVIDNFTAERAAKRETCRHEGWSFEKHGRCCFECGTFVVDFGD